MLFLITNLDSGLWRKANKMPRLTTAERIIQCTWKWTKFMRLLLSYFFEFYRIMKSRHLFSSEGKKIPPISSYETVWNYLIQEFCHAISYIIILALGFKTWEWKDTLPQALSTFIYLKVSLNFPPTPHWKSFITQVSGLVKERV